MSDELPDRQAQLIELIERDYDATRSLIDSVVSTSVQLRVIGMTLTVALLGFAVDRSSFPVAFCAIASTLLFAYLDAYHGWIYAQALARARKHDGSFAAATASLSVALTSPTVRTILTSSLLSTSSVCTWCWSAFGCYRSVGHAPARSTSDCTAACSH
jgi:hypothetical protein